MKFWNEAVVSVLHSCSGRLVRVAKRVLGRSADGARALAARSERTAAVLVTVLIAVSAAAVGLSGLETLGEQNRLRDSLAADVAQLEREATELRNSIAALREDPAAFEVHAKTHHHLVEPGEVVVLLRPPAEPAAAGREPVRFAPGIRPPAWAPGRAR